MASPFEQQSVRRKFIYFGLVLALFTVSLLHRKLVVNVQAGRLMMRDVGRGKADLTDAALRLTLSGVRGVAVTSLWLAAQETQKRHEWNELELAVDSLTRLQPHFTSPWFFQGWNLAFNVAVECDRPRDKYYYISRGITLLCRGDEKNDPGQAVPPQPWPASPDMRFQIANTYHRKIGQSDENKTMRCLFELSCMPAAERDPEGYYMAGPQGKQLDLVKFKAFCENHPRLVRRLRTRLTGFEKAEAILQFLSDNKDIPARLEDRAKLEEDQRLSEFPILPPQHPRALAICGYPDWRSEALASSVEDFDVFVCMRAWHTYAQVPLPDPDPDSDYQRRRIDTTQHRMPRITPIVFRSYPARSQAFFAEELQKDGWFDDGGWAITGWFDTPSRKQSVVVGRGAQYHSGEAWNKAHELYYRFGLLNGLYMEPGELKRQELDARLKGQSSPAFLRLQAAKHGRDLTNFEDYMRQTKVERTQEAVAARKAIFEVKDTEESGNFEVINVYREKVLPQWLDLLLRHPEFRQISTIQEETYELQAKFFETLQHLYQSQFSNLAKAVAYAAPTWPTWPWPGVMPPAADPERRFDKDWPLALVKYTVDKKGLKVMPIRDVEGMLDQLFLLEGSGVEALKPVAKVLARQVLWPPPPLDPAAPDFAFARFVVWPPPKGETNPEIGLGHNAVWPPALGFLPAKEAAALLGGGGGAVLPTPLFMMLSSAEERRILTQAASHRHPPSGQGWTPLVPMSSVQQVRQTLQWMRQRVEQPPQ